MNLIQVIYAHKWCLLYVNYGTFFKKTNIVLNIIKNASTWIETLAIAACYLPLMIDRQALWRCLACTLWFFAAAIKLFLLVSPPPLPKKKKPKTKKNQHLCMIKLCKCRKKSHHWPNPYRATLNGGIGVAVFHWVFVMLFIARLQRFWISLKLPNSTAVLPKYCHNNTNYHLVITRLIGKCEASKPKKKNKQTKYKYKYKLL